MNCDGFILPEQVVSRVARSSSAARIAGRPSRGTSSSAGTFRDERSRDGRQRSRRHRQRRRTLRPRGVRRARAAALGQARRVSLRGGVEYEWLPGRLRVRAGSYWEPGRFDGVGGRLHAHVRHRGPRASSSSSGAARRGRISLTGDVAERYRNVGYLDRLLALRYTPRHANSIAFPRVRARRWLRPQEPEGRSGGSAEAAGARPDARGEHAEAGARRAGARAGDRHGERQRPERRAAAPAAGATTCARRSPPTSPSTRRTSRARAS